LSCCADGQFVKALEKLRRKPLPPTPVIISGKTIIYEF
jgi:hypothetical protein